MRTERLAWGDIDHYLSNKPISSKLVADVYNLAKEGKVNTDCLGKCQLVSKFKIIEALRSHVTDESRVVIACAWYGQLATLLFHAGIGSSYYGIDIDPATKIPAQKINDTIEYCHTCADIFSVDYSRYDLIINTSCEHIKNVDKWLELVPKNKLVVLQSNNFSEPKDHINCVDNIDEFIQQCNGLLDIKDAVTLSMPIYDRFLIVGTKT